MRPTLFAILLTCALSPAAAGTAYRIVHPDGTVEFTDEPPPRGGERFTLPGVQTYDPGQPSPRTEPTEPEPAPKEGKPATPDYRRLTVARPRAEETFWVSQWQVPVQLSLEPGLAEGHSIEVSLDGRVVASGRQTTFTLQPVYRGAHQLRARVVGPDGQTFIQSESVMFYVHKHQVNRP